MLIVGNHIARDYLICLLPLDLEFAMHILKMIIFPILYDKHLSWVDRKKAFIKKLKWYQKEGYFDKALSLIYTREDTSENRDKAKSYILSWQQALLAFLKPLLNAGLNAQQSVIITALKHLMNYWQGLISKPLSTMASWLSCLNKNIEIPYAPQTSVAQF